MVATTMLAVAGFGLTVLGTAGVLLAVLRAAGRDDENLARQERALYLRRLRANTRPDGKWRGDADAH